MEVESSTLGLQRKIVAPLVSRHIDFLAGIWDSDNAVIDRERLKHALNQSILLLGSAPVGPTTCERLLKYAGKLPTGMAML